MGSFLRELEMFCVGFWIATATKTTYTLQYCMAPVGASSVVKKDLGEFGRVVH